ncbi:hypothetical protein Lal_00042884 [Lupinus albus]|nr:hypothetical protein Lal_00042884 [Lupinus albus]
MDAKFSLQNTVISETLNLKTFYFLTYCGNKTFLIFDVKRTIFILSLFTIFLLNMGKYIVLDTNTFSSLCCDIPMQGDITGFGIVCEWDDYDHKRFYFSLCRISKEEIEQRKQQSIGETVKNRDILSAGYLKLEEHLLHYFLSYVILPKFSNHSQISDIKL